METTSPLLVLARRGLTACALTLVFSLSACGGDDDTDETAAPPAPTTPATPAPQTCEAHCAP